MANGEEPGSLREVVRELAHLAISVQQLTQKMDAGFESIRHDMLRKDVFTGREEVLKTKIRALEADVTTLHQVKRNQNAAIAGMLLTILGGIVVFLLTRGLVGVS